MFQEQHKRTLCLALRESNNRLCLLYVFNIHLSCEISHQLHLVNALKIIYIFKIQTVL